MTRRLTFALCLLLISCPWCLGIVCLIPKIAGGGIRITVEILGGIR